MKGGKRPLGYTIVEVMIFLAISSVMFVLAASFISGKQEIVEFKQGLTSVATQIHNTVNDVSNGEYPAFGNITCTAAAGSPPTITATNTAQGTNNGCIFLGKVIQFDVASNGGVVSNINTDTYTIAARQTDSNTGEDVTSFSQALPIAVDKFTTTNTLQAGLQFAGAYLCSNAAACSGGTPTPIGSAIGLFSSFGQYTQYGVGVPADLQSGSQSVITVQVPGATNGETRSQMEATIAAPTGLQSIGNGTINPISGGSYLLLCFTDGAQTGSVSIGGSDGQQFTTSLQVGGPTACSP